MSKYIDIDGLSHFYEKLSTEAFIPTPPTEVEGVVSSAFSNEDNLSEHIGKIEYNIQDIYTKLYTLATILSDSGVSSNELTSLIDELETIVSPEDNPG